MKKTLSAAIIAATGRVCAARSVFRKWGKVLLFPCPLLLAFLLQIVFSPRAQNGPPAGAYGSGAGGSGTGLPAGPTTPNSRAQICTETPSGGVAPGTCTWGLPGNIPTDRGSGEASYTFLSTDIGTSVRETNAAGETFTIPDGNVGGFILPVNIGIIVRGGASTLQRQTSSQIACTPNGALANSCPLALGANYILTETSDFNYTLSVSADSNGNNAQNIRYSEVFCNENGGSNYGILAWSGSGTGQATSTVNGVSAKYPCAVTVTAQAASGDWNFFTQAGAGFQAGQYQYLFGSDFYFAFQRQTAAAAPQEIVEVGIGDASVTAQIANFVGLRVVATAAKTNFFAVCRAGAADGTTVDSTVLEDTAIHFVHLHLTSQNSATVTLDSGSALSLTSGCPAAATHMTPVFYISTSETTAKTVNALFAEWDNVVTRP